MLLLIGLTVFGFTTVSAGFIPAQDRGYLITAIQLPDGASLERTDEVVRNASQMILETPGVEFAVAFAGFSGATRANSANAGAIFVGPKPFEEREEGEWQADEVLATLQAKLSTIVDADIFVIPPPPVQGLGTAGGFKFVVQDRASHGAARPSGCNRRTRGRGSDRAGPSRCVFHISRFHAAALCRRGSREGQHAQRTAGKHL